DGRDGTDAPDNQDRQDVSGTSDGQGGTGMPDNQDGQDGAGMPDNQDGQGGAGTPDGQGNQSGTDPESTKPDPAAGYASVLNQYRIALKEEWEPQRLTDEGLSILTRYCYDGNARENVGFAFLDVDGDGEAELLIGAIAGDPFVERQIFELYTLKDGAPKQVFSGRERSRYYLCEEEDGSFIVANEGSLSAADSEWDYYTLQDGELSLIRTIVSWHVEAGADAADGRLQGIMEEEEAEEFVKVHEARYMKIEYTPFMDFDNPETKQLRLILSQKELWELKGDYLAPEVAYAVTDLDRNGRLELIAEACQGTGIYTYFWIYEVSEDGESLVPCGRTLSEEYDSQADIMTMSPCVPMYYNPQTGQRNYIFIDGTKDGAARYYESQWALSLQNGYLTEQCLASMATEYENAGADVTTTYRPGEWKDIRVTNQEEYRTAGDRAFDGWQKEYASIGWFGAPEERENAELTQWAWLEEMEESYDRFYTQVKEPAASRPQEVIEEEFRESWKQKVTEQGYSEQEAADWYARFQREGMVLEEGDRFSDVCIGDFDNNGITDCFFAVNKHETMDDHVWWYRSTGVVFWGSMNGEAFYCREVTNDCIIAVSVVAGDVNHDGLIELVLGGDTGGCGGGGCIIWQMLQYRDGQIVELKIPADENWHAEENTSGYRISVYETEKTRTCRAVLEADGREVLFTVSGDSRWDYASMLDKEMPGWRDGKEPYGGNGRSYTGFEIVTRDGKDYLLAKEYLQARTAYGGIGFACLLFDWDENGSVYVKDFYVEPF
ncbi:MAG: VCBS repeat-containing protein, partial [Lachnospiraceae bacterium]|nr:VCBS repeat-containing protein [Lachnospiraceae bacterium]